MVQHHWGDPNVDWDGIEDAVWNIARRLSRYGRIHIIDAKEKYGTVRISCEFGWATLHDAMYPRNRYYPVSMLDNISMLWLNFLVIPFQRKVYRLVYKYAVIYAPHLREEILEEADWPELLQNL